MNFCIFVSLSSQLVCLWGRFWRCCCRKWRLLQRFQRGVCHRLRDLDLQLSEFHLWVYHWKQVVSPRGPFGVWLSELPLLLPPRYPTIFLFFFLFDVAIVLYTYKGWELVELAVESWVSGYRPGSVSHWVTVQGFVDLQQMGVLLGVVLQILLSNCIFSNGCFFWEIEQGL